MTKGTIHASMKTFINDMIMANLLSIRLTIASEYTCIGVLTPTKSRYTYRIYIILYAC